MRILTLCLLLIACFACTDKKTFFEDKTRVKIADLQDRRASDSLSAFLSSDNVANRKAAALAFASVQDTNVISGLWSLSDVEAVFALGQMYNHGSVGPLKEKIRAGNTPALRREAFEGLGKVIQKDELDVFIDSTNAEGVAWGIYRAGLRGITDSITIIKEASILSNAQSTRDDRLGAVHFFSRTAFKNQPSVTTAVVTAAGDTDTEIRMAAVNALSKVNDIAAIRKATTDPDYRVRVNSARALRTQSWDVAKPLFDKLLADENPHVNVAAAEVILNISKDTTALLSWAKAAKNWRAQATLYECLLKLAPGHEKDVQSICLNTTNPYQKAALLNALSNSSMVSFVFDQYKENQTKVVRSTASGVLADISSDLEIFRQIISDGDQGSIIPICNALRDTTRGFKKLITDYSFLEAAKAKLSLPRDYETYVPLEQTLNYLKGLPPPAPLKNEFNHPIDWSVAATIAKDQHVLIKTSKGDIVMQLFIEEAPGSVVNFVKLVNSGYFNDKYFHRVVPNFVIQTGCNRGDGFGSEDYSIRSEFSQRKYKTGSVGMASAGKDTEGTQWFITHSPTPHLDGKYTIFAEVVSGMDVVHQIEVGDKIIEARLTEY